MDKNDIYNVGSDIMDAVNKAVDTGDFSALNETLRNVTGGAAGTAADALYSFQDHIQGGPAGQAGSGEGAGGRTYGHAGRSTQNMTEEYMKRAQGARHHTTFASRMSPFLQRKISRGSGNGQIVGGIVSLVFAGMSLLDTMAAGFLGSLFSNGGNIFSVYSIIGLLITGGLAVLGGVLIKNGNERKKLVKEYYEYGRVVGTAEYVEIGKLARAVGESRETVLGNLEKMISEDMLPASWFDRQKTTLMLSEDLYNEYLRLERERQAQEAEDAKARLQAAGQETADAGAAGESADPDLQMRPEDAALPEEARRIVSEGLLYMGRIRNYNRLIEDSEISDQLFRLEVTMNRILEQIRKDPSSAPNLRRLMVYYLPTTMKLLQAYVELDRQPSAGENITSTKREIREALGTINVAFENLLDSLFQDMAWDISSDISVMKTMMAQDGLTGDRMREAAARQSAVQQSGAQQGSAWQNSPQQGSAYMAGMQDGSAPQTAAAAGADVPQTETALAGGAEFIEGYQETPLTDEGGQGLLFTDAGTAMAQPLPQSAGQSRTQEQDKKEGIRLTFGE